MSPMRPLVLLAEVLLIGVLVCLTSLLVITALASAAAGACLLRDLVSADQTPTVRRYFLLLGKALRDPLAVLAPTGLLAVGTLDTLAVLGGLPGGRLFGMILAAALAGLIVAGLRAAATWHPESSWRTVLSAAADDTIRDWPGSLMIAAAVLVMALVVSQAPAFVLIAPGLLVLAAVAVVLRAHPNRKSATRIGDGVVPLDRCW